MELSPSSTINKYAEFTHTGNVDGLKSLFSPSALMSGYFEGEFFIGTPSYFFDEVRDNPSPSETGAVYETKVVSEEIFGEIAQVVMKEDGYLGLKFINLFQLALIENEWLITSKSYIDR